jgi:hypothetical protein
MEARGEGRGAGRAWAVAFAVVAVVVVLVGAALYVFHSLRRLPGEALEGGRKVLGDLAGVAAAFNQGSVETRFLSYATRVTGSSYLQFATVHQTEVFRRTDRSSTLWGTLDLPEVVVEATAPVEYTYYLDLDAEWRFVRDGRTVRVVAPRPRFNKPAIDASEIRYEVRESSLLRDETAALAKLKEGLTRMSMGRARENLELVRELGRKKTARFVSTWLIQAFGDGGDYAVEVRFADEERGPGGAGPGRLTTAEEPAP